MITIARFLTLAAILFGSFASASEGAANPIRPAIYLVVNTGSPVVSLTRKEALDLFTGRTRALQGGGFAQLFDLPRDSEQRALFYRTLTGRSMAQINSYWSRLMFSGQVLPPQPLASEQAMVDSLGANPHAVGYLTEHPTDRRLRIVLVLQAAAP